MARRMPNSCTRRRNDKHRMHAEAAEGEAGGDDERQREQAERTDQHGVAARFDDLGPGVHGAQRPDVEIVQAAE